MPETARDATDAPAALFGHPPGLFALFFAEMWERFSYYGMRALLVFYMIKGFLRCDDKAAYTVYGAYTALVYAAPFIGGMLADRLLGARRAVIFGGLLMAAGHCLMTVEHEAAFFGALALLICGNGFFKPNISTMVGRLYPAGSSRRDAGFTIFYMGVNLGAAMSPVLCGYIGETYGWHYGFGLATIGMLTGVATFVAPTRLSQGLILLGAAVTAIAMPFLQDSALQLAVRLFLSAALLTAAAVSVTALGRDGLPRTLGAPANPAASERRIGGWLRADHAVVAGTLLTVPLIALTVRGGHITGILLTVTGVAALAFLVFEAVFRCTRPERHRLTVALVLMFFAMLFFAFFEQAGSSMNNFTDRNVNRVVGARVVAAEDVGQDIRFRISPKTDDPALAGLPVLSQAQLGHAWTGGVFRLNDLDRLRAEAGTAAAGAGAGVLTWRVDASHVGMAVGGSEIPASEFQAVNPIFILLFGLVFSSLWSFLGARGLEPGTPVKFALALLQIGAGFGALWYGARSGDARGMVGLPWLLLGYLLHTTGELCLSPVGLSMITRLAPARLGSTVMGAWFLATAFSNYLAGLIAKLTGVESEGAEAAVIPPPAETVGLYGGVFGRIAIAALIAAVVCVALSPWLKRWMHEEEDRR